MKTEREFKDIENIKNELNSILIKFDKIDQRMIAIGLDYNQYFKRNISNKNIYSIRDSIIYRLNATKLHIQILVNLIENLDNELTSVFEKEGARNVHSYFSHRKSDISALFDSIIFHIISAFDYVSFLVSYVCLQSGKKTKWTKLAKSSRAQENTFCNTNLSNVIDELDRTFVGRLYDHRSYLIHENKESRYSEFSIDFSNGKVKTKIVSSNKFNKNFSKIRNQDKDFSLSYILVWLLKETTNSILKIQYGLKEFMEENKDFDKPVFYTKGPDGERITITKDIWSNKN